MEGMEGSLGRQGAGVLTAFSHEGVGHFGKPIEVDSNANGYVNALLLEDGSALVAWRDRAGPTEKLQLAQVRQDGMVHGPFTVYHGDFPSWPSRHIDLAQVGDTVYGGVDRPRAAASTVGESPSCQHHGSAGCPGKSPVMLILDTLDRQKLGLCQ